MNDDPKLRALDAVWLELEHGGPPVAIGSVSRCDGPAPRVGDVRELVRGRLDAMPRLAQVPGPDRAWVDVDLDLGHHVRRDHAHGEPLEAYVSRLMLEPFDAGRPRWSLHVVDGIGGDWALVWRLHHSLADGLGALMLAGHVFDTAVDGGPTLPQAAMAARRAAAARGAAAAAGRGRLAGTLHAAGAALAVLPHLPAAVASVTPASPSSLTGELGPGRRWRSLELPLDEVKRVGRAEAGTVNDVVVTLVTGGLRNALLADGQVLRDDTVVRCMLPVSLRAPDDDRAHNQVSAMLASLPVGVADPRERLHTVVRHLDHLKRSRGFLAVPALLDLVDRAVPGPLQELVVSHLGDSLTPWYLDTLVTNVPGPAFPLWLLGRRVRSLHPVIPVAAHVRCTIGVMSFDGVLDVGLTAAVPGPDVDALARGMVGDLEALGR